MSGDGVTSESRVVRHGDGQAGASTSAGARAPKVGRARQEGAFGGLQTGRLLSAPFRAASSFPCLLPACGPAAASWLAEDVWCGVHTGYILSLSPRSAPYNLLETPRKYNEFLKPAHPGPCGAWWAECRVGTCRQGLRTPIQYVQQPNCFNVCLRNMASALEEFLFQITGGSVTRENGDPEALRP
ncbi:hypothetical protein NDU88_006718 [Pleurodeles waltl]|uniref:Uncharacterized protein n=1 Tax=Pleurodeles waltl TaxID=8319 RepID=A0AAV7QJK2_PLEWA|nr:hypothetical protein NDU88_006718 [Pleurodeles waltl]